jgi:hypothetical protein
MKIKFLCLARLMQKIIKVNPIQRSSSVPSIAEKDFGFNLRNYISENKLAFFSLFLVFEATILGLVIYLTDGYKKH